MFPQEIIFFNVEFYIITQIKPNSLRKSGIVGFRYYLIPITNLVPTASVIMDVRLLILRLRTVNKSLIASTEEIGIPLIINYQRIVKITIRRRRLIVSLNFKVVNR